MLVQLKIVSEIQGNLGVCRECKVGLFQELPSKREKGWVGCFLVCFFFFWCLCVMGSEKS